MNLALRWNWAGARLPDIPMPGDIERSEGTFNGFASTPVAPMNVVDFYQNEMLRYLGKHSRRQIPGTDLLIQNIGLFRGSTQYGHHFKFALHIST